MARDRGSGARYNQIDSNVARKQRPFQLSVKIDSDSGKDLKYLSQTPHGQTKCRVGRVLVPLAKQSLTVRLNLA